MTRNYMYDWRKTQSLGFELQSSHAILGKLMLIIFYFSSKIATIITNGDIFDIEKSFPLLNTTLLLAQFWKLDNDTKRN